MQLVVAASVRSPGAWPVQALLCQLAGAGGQGEFELFELWLLPAQQTHPVKL